MSISRIVRSILLCGAGIVALVGAWDINDTGFDGDYAYLSDDYCRAVNEDPIGDLITKEQYNQARMERNAFSWILLTAGITLIAVGGTTFKKEQEK